MGSTWFKAAGMVLATVVVAVPAALAAATLVGWTDPTEVVVEGLVQVLVVGWWPSLVGAMWLEAQEGWKELERPVEIGWVWGAITLLVSLGLEAEVLETGNVLLQELVALDVGVAVLLVLLVAAWIAGQPANRKRKGGQKGSQPFQPTWSASWHPGEKSHPTF